MSSNETKTLFFKVNAEAKSVIGKDLINNDSIAILELVKNAYDANSPHVNITFKNTTIDREQGIITIEDRGHGMSLKDIKQKWLNIAFSEKKKETIRGGRRVAGNKGVGRFSCDRLGKRLDLYTRKAQKETIRLSIEWKEFEGVGPDTEISHIPIQYTTLSPQEFEEQTGHIDFVHGTILQISQLRSVWTEQKLLSLRRELERFANPHQDVQLDAFTIKLICPDHYQSDKQRKDHERINGVISNTIIDELSARTSSIESTIDKLGDSITTTLTHRGQRLFTIIEKNTFPHLRAIQTRIVFLGPYDKALFTRKMGYQSIKFGSVFLFLHGFRISPYGEPTDDWLGIDQRKQQKMRSYLGTRDILGRIEVNDEDSVGERWRIVSNREGLVQTPAYHELVDSDPTGFFWRVFRKLQRYVVEGIGWDSIVESALDLESKILRSHDPYSVGVDYKESEEFKETTLISLLKGIITAGGTRLNDVQLIEFDPSLASMLKRQKDEQVKAFFDDFEELIGKELMSKDYKDNLSKLRSLMADERKLTEELQRERDEARQAAEKARQEAAEAQDKAEKAQAKVIEATKKIDKERQVNLFLKATSSQDITDVVNMQHQVLTWSTAIDKGCNRALKIISNNHAVNISELQDILNRISRQNKRIIKTAKFATKKNLRLNAEPRTANLLKFIHDYVTELGTWNFFRGIDVISHLPTDITFQSMFKPLEVSILLDNMITNSQKAKAKHFFVSLKSCDEAEMVIIFDDDGGGLDSSITEPSDVFRRGFTTTNGSGIGLDHCVDIVKEMKGTIEYVPSKQGGFSLMWSTPAIPGER